MSVENQTDDTIGFELSDDDLEAISGATSRTVSNELTSDRTPYTIENAPIPKAVPPVA